MYNKGDEAMKIFFKRVVVVLLIVTMFFGGIPNVKALAITQSTVSSQLNSLIGQYANHTATSAQMYMGSQCKGFFPAQSRHQILYIKVTDHRFT